MPIETKPLLAKESSRFDYTDYNQARGQYNNLIDAWKAVATKAERNRQLRYQKGTEASDLRAAGILKADETYDPVRIIDTNIRREQPQLVNYLTQSRRSIIFTPSTNQTIDGLENLEADFTNKARYLGWELPFIRCIDGAQTHGWDSVECIFDISYPGNFCFHHVGHEKLIFALDSEDINVQEVIIKKEQYSASQLLDFVDNKSWSKTQVEAVIESCKKNTATTNSDVNCEIYKIFFKKDGVVMVGWMAPACQEYLKTPEPLYLGVHDTTAPAVEDDFPVAYETEFPFTLYRYVESEDPCITEQRGRAALDEATQEAVSALYSGMINGVLRASNIYAAPQATNINANPNAAPKALEVVLKNGAIYDQPLSFFNTPYPDAAIVQMIQAVVSQNQQEQSQVNFATLNRKDSGKTATEVQAATQKAGELSSVQIILISIFIRQAYSKGWRIYQSRVLQGKIDVDPAIFGLFGEVNEETVPGPVIDTLDPMTGIMMPTQGMPTVQITVIPREYIIKSSGDVDVVQRAENLQRKMQAWPVIANTPVAMEFLKDILRASFPEDAARYVKTLDEAAAGEAQQLKAMLMNVSNVLKSIVTDPSGAIKPEYAAQEGQLQQLATQVATAVGGQETPQPQ